MTPPPLIESFLLRVEDCTEGIVSYLNEYRILVDTMPPLNLESYDFSSFGGNCHELQNILCNLQQMIHEWYRTSVKETTDVYAAVYTMLTGLQQLYAPTLDLASQQKRLHHLIDAVDRKHYELPEEMRCSRRYVYTFSTEPTAVQEWIDRIFELYRGWAVCHISMEETLKDYASVFDDEIICNKIRVTQDSRHVVMSACSLTCRKLAELRALDTTVASEATLTVVLIVLSGLSELHLKKTQEEQVIVLRNIQQDIDKRNALILERETHMKGLFEKSIFFTVYPNSFRN